MRLTQAGEALVRHAAGILAGLTAAEEEVAAIAGLRAGPGPARLLPQRQLHPRPDRPRRPARRPPGHPGLPGGGRAAALGRDAARGRLRRGARLPLRGRRGRRGVGRPGRTPPAHRPARRPRPRRAPAGRARSRSPSGSWPTSRGSPAARAAAASWSRSARSAGFTPRIDFATDDYPAVVGLVGAGLGVAVLPELAIESVRPKGARTVTLEPAVRREIVALTLPDLAQVPAVAATLDQLARAAARLAGARRRRRRAPAKKCGHARACPRAETFLQIVRARVGSAGRSPTPTPAGCAPAP